MKSVILYSLLCCMILGSLSSCKKGDKVFGYEELSKVRISNLPASYQLYYNDQLAALDRTGVYFLPLGEAALTVINEEGKAIGTFPVTITTGSMTLAYLNIEGNTTLLNNTLAEEPYKEGFVKMQLADFSGQSETPVNLLVTASDNMGEFVNIRDTIFNVTNKFKGSFEEVNLNGVDPYNLNYYWFYVLDQNNNPVLKDGYPLAFTMMQQMDYSSGSGKPCSVYQGYFTWKDELYIGPMDSYGPIGNGVSVYLDAGVSLFQK